MKVVGSLVNGMSDMVNSPPHYNVHEIEVIDIIEKYFSDNYHLANCVKYLLRSSYKGEQLQDIKKMIWYAQRWVDNQETIKIDGMTFDRATGNAIDYDDWYSCQCGNNDCPTCGTGMAFRCENCKAGTNLVDSKGRCEFCREISDNHADIDSKASVTPPKPLDPLAKVIPHNIPKDVLEAHTERQNREMDRREEYRREYRHSPYANRETTAMEQLTIYD